MVVEMAVVGFHVTVWADRVGVEGAADAVDCAADAVDCAADAVDCAADADALTDFDAVGFGEG